MSSAQMAADMIADLDAALISAGETITIRRYTAPSGDPRPKIDIANVPASVRPIKPDQLVGAIDQTASKIVVSPSLLAALLPLRKGDKVVVQGRERNIEFPGPIFVGSVPVRFNLLVTG